MPISFRPSGTAEYVDRTVTSFLLSDSTCAPGAPGFESVPPFDARMSFVSSYGVVREEQLGESTDSRRDFTGLEGRTFTRKTTSRFPELQRPGACGPTGLSKGTRPGDPSRDEAAARGRPQLGCGERRRRRRL